ncbi:MAG: 4Fe-4S binding protein [Planctomycetes bacterium]|nr:4Fe-4S binding protein [Planctomycetota bacterium]
MKARPSPWRTSRRVVGAAFLLLFVLAVRGDLDWFRGSPRLSMSFGLLPLVDPLVALELVLAGGGLPMQVAIGCAILIAVTALLGPVFCGWVCPLGWLLDINDSLRRRMAGLLRRRGRSAAKAKVGGAVAPVRRVVNRGLRFGVLGVSLGFVVISGLPLFVVLSPINLVVEGVARGAVIGLSVLVLLVVVEWIVPRLWCRLLCPLGALHAFVGRAAPLRVRIDPALAGRTPCQLCSRHCTMGIRVMEDFAVRGAESIDDPACTRCGSCLDACPSSVLRLGFRGVAADGGQATSGTRSGVRDREQLQESSSARAQSRS